MAELGAFFGNPNLQRQVARARALAEKRDVNTLADPRTYAAVQGLLGTAPDQMGFSVLHPDYQKIRATAEPAYALGLLGQLSPILAPLTKGLPVGASIKNVGDDLLSYRGSHKAPSPDFGAPLHDLTGGGQMYPADVYSAKAVQFYGTGYPKADKEAFELAKKVRGNPDAEVTMYRAVPKDEKITKINDGDWVTLSKDYAKNHGESVLGKDYKIISQKVKAKELWTNADSIHEFGYHPQKPIAPQEEALRLAQERAALPIEQGGLGLPKDNTPEMRAIAMEFDIPAFHTSRTGVDTNILDSGKYAISPFDAIGTHFGTKEAALDRFNRTVGTTEQIKGSSYPVLLRSDKPYLNESGQIYTEDPLSMLLSSKSDYGNLPKSNKKLREEIFANNAVLPYINDVESAGSISYIAPPDNIRSRFAAFDPWRKTAAIASAMGVAAPDLLAQEAPQSLLADEEKIKLLRSLLDY